MPHCGVFGVSWFSRFMRRSLCLLLFASVAVCPLMQAQAEGVASVAQGGGTPPGLSAPVPGRKPPLPVGAHIDAYTKFGSDRRLTGVEAFVPLSWDGQVLTFTDLRFVGDDADGREFNAGLGARRVSDDGSYILSGYGFFDRRRSSTGNLYSQMTAGAEVLTEDWDFRVNGYLPLSKERVLSETRTALPASLTLSGTGILASGGEAIAQAIEHPMAGADIEIGRKLPFLESTWFADTRAYAGAFHFDAEGVRAMDGLRFRIETAPLSWLRFGAEHQQDNIRGETDFVEARVRIPLDFWKSREGRSATRPEGILNRLDTRISRDVDVVTQGVTQTRDERIDDVPVLNADTGTAQKVWVVDNEAAGGGDGSVEHPFNTLAAAQAAAGAHDIVYVRAGDGSSTGMNAGVTLGQTGQRLIGSGVALDFDANTMQVSGIPGGVASGAVIRAATAAPLITNAGGNGVSITADDVEVAGFTVNGAADNGIYARNADGVTIRDVTASGSTNDGIKIEADGAAVDLTGVVIEGVSATGNRNGIRLYARSDASLAAKVESSAATGNSQHGVIVYDDSTAGAVDADLGGGSQGSAGLNAITGNTLEDLALDTDGAALFAQNNWWGQAGGPTATEIYDGAPLDTGLVGHWTFDEGSGATAYDRSGNGNNGTLINAPVWISGINGGALQFNGNNSYVNIPDPVSGILDFDINSNFTLSAWVNPNNLGNQPFIIDKRHSFGGPISGYTFYLEFTGFPSLRLGNGSVANGYSAGGGPYAIGTWHYYTISVNRTGNATFYADGTQLGTANVSGFGDIGGVQSIFIGTKDATASNTLNGLIDDVRVYNRALSASEIAELYRMDTTGTVTTTGALASAP